jgi:putative YhbY family RNA-binding protein
MPAIHLTPAQRKDHRAAAHHLNPVVMIGAEGLTPAVLKEAEAALSAHGLIKIRVFNDQRTERDALLDALADQLNAAPIQHIGKLLVLWRPTVEKEKAEPTHRMPGPRVVRVVKPAKTPTHRPQVKKLTVLGNERLTSSGSVKRAKPHQISQKKRALGST